MIQNADDNQYADSVPTIEFNYTSGCLRVDCNETGFRYKNVEAICQIANSTKLAQDGANPFIGEKGIGFKSVFKVADVVYIKSNHYSFKLDRNNGGLGIITPVWVDNPPFEVRPNYTTFYLELSRTCNVNALKDKLNNLSLPMLLFLRQLQRIKVQVDGQPSVELAKRLKRQQILEK